MAGREGKTLAENGVSWPQQAYNFKTEVRHGNESLSRLMAETLRKRKILGEGLRIKRKENALPPTVTSVYPDAQDPRDLGFLPVRSSSSQLPSPKHSSLALLHHRCWCRAGLRAQMRSRLVCSLPGSSFGNSLRAGFVWSQLTWHTLQETSSDFFDLAGPGVIIVLFPRSTYLPGSFLFLFCQT